jgi:serine/threonine protein kinase
MAETSAERKADSGAVGQLPYGTLLSGRYELGDVLGVGGMSTVYRARDTTLRREIAVKVMADWLRGDAAYGRRFTAEAQAAAGLNHPNIVAVHDTGEDGEHRYIVMELVDGKALDDCPPMSPEHAVAMAIQVAEGLEYAHQNGIIHCDIKPGNILLDGSQRAKIVDFGIARAATQTWAMATTVLGTAAYMSPEVVEGGRPDARTDVYSLAVVLYEQLAGRLPFEGESMAALTAQRLVKDPTPLRRLKPEISAQLERPVMKALLRNPQKRPASADEFAQDLRNASAILNAARTQPVVVKPPVRARAAAHAPRSKPKLQLEDAGTLWRAEAAGQDRHLPTNAAPAPTTMPPRDVAEASDTIWRADHPDGPANPDPAAMVDAVTSGKHQGPRSVSARVAPAFGQGSWLQNGWLRVLATVALLLGLFLVAFAATRLVLGDSDPTPSTADYTADVQVAFDAARANRNNLAAQVQAAGEGPSSFDEVRELYLPFLEGYIESSRELLDALGQIEPPDEFGRVHENYLDALSSETDALQAFADGFAGVETVEQLAGLQSTGFQEASAGEDAACQALQDAIVAGGQQADLSCSDNLPGVPQVSSESELDPVAAEDDDEGGENGNGEGEGEGGGGDRGNGNNGQRNGEGPGKDDDDD